MRSFNSLERDLATKRSRLPWEKPHSHFFLIALVQPASTALVYGSSHRPLAGTGRRRPLQPAFRVAVNIGLPENPGRVRSSRGIGLGQRRPPNRAPAGLRVFPRAGWNPCRPWSARRRRHCGQRRDRSRSALLPVRRQTEPVASLSSILAKAPSVWDRLQPAGTDPRLESMSSRLPPGPIADRPNASPCPI